MVNRLLIILGLVLCNISYLQAQDIEKKAQKLIDSTLIGQSIFDILLKSNDNGGEVQLNQPNYMPNTLHYYKESNKHKKRNGFRIRLFFDNKQTARGESENISALFVESFPVIPVYRSYTNPYFKVVVGNYRTKSDAIKALQEINKVFPNAIVVKENIDYPALL